MIEKEFIPYELALELKQLGFDEPCFGYYVDGELRDLVDKAEFEEKAESILVQMGDFHPVVAHGIVSSMEKEQEWFYSTRKAQFVEKGKALSFSEEELNAVWDNLVISAKSFELN